LTKRKTAPRKQIKGLTKKESFCLARHLMVQYRQTSFCEEADISEACGGCKYLDSCRAFGYVDTDLYIKITSDAGIHVSFRVNCFPLVPHRI